MRARALCAAGALLLGGLGEAWAQDAPRSAIGHWNIVQLPASCVALNRPLREVNFAPWNSMSLVARRDGSVRMGVCFWPSATVDRQSDEVRAVIRLKPTQRATITMQHTSPGCFFATGPLPADLLAELRQIDHVLVNIIPAILEFDTQDLGAVLDQLETCRTTLR